ncbi:Sucrase/ferredoxin-like-domain-containing protein [Kockovaella imperatae]|uniref:Sucrase/ferredoxin-like-domain-containing protein n=1 Tax=Kockovaella imperatae TaxID=4999 RepID=A0A1Y1UTQ2_9TREE|nr:Sucrase/ferredoxin-like-domain-containing protein [Kockovaella imperatae]ORX40904.1 Sucrase/ferredoxin-like-domain-containing protein [Kockovaella imperatae]
MQWIAKRSVLLQPGIRTFQLQRFYSTSAQDDPWPLPLPRSLAARQGLFLLALPAPPSAWPAKLEFASPLLSAASQVFKRNGLAVNAYYDGSGAAEHLPIEEETYPARLLFPDGRTFEYPEFRLDSLQDHNVMRDANYKPDPVKALATSSGRNVTGLQEIFVCTHGARDCRCSDRGGSLVAALRKEIERKGAVDAVAVREIAHVGGHKYAANAILAPSLDMLSNLTAEHAPALLSHIMTGRPLRSSLWKHWRGRYGLTEEQQGELWHQVDPGEAQTVSNAAGSSVRIRFETFEGDIKEVNARLGDSLLQIGKENGLPSLEGVCGGNLECATCHLYLPPTGSPPPVPEPSEEELDMLGYAIDYRDGQSRLGCQVKVTQELVKWIEDGGIIKLPRY